jgi:hypothetical protein
MPNYAQASARAPRLSQPSTGSPMLLAPVSPYHQQVSTMPSAAPAAHSSCHLVPFVSMGGGCPHARPHNCSYGLMALSPLLSMVKTPSVSKLAFYQPACSAAPPNAEALADLEAPSQDIAYTISKGRQVPDGWGVVHLVRHVNLLAGHPCAIKALSKKINRKKARRRGGDCNVPESPIPSPFLQPVCRLVWTDPGQTPGQARVLGVVAPL